jgi:hypothetical protein
MEITILLLLKNSVCIEGLERHKRISSFLSDMGENFGFLYPVAGKDLKMWLGGAIIENNRML